MYFNSGHLFLLYLSFLDVFISYNKLFISPIGGWGEAVIQLYVRCVLHPLMFLFHYINYLLPLSPPPFQEVRVGPWVQPTLLIRSWFQFEYFVIINFRIVLLNFSLRLNDAYYLKDQGRPSNRSTTVMFRGTPLKTSVYYRYGLEYINVKFQIKKNRMMV